MTTPPQVYLASGSPRRRELLAQIGLQFAVLEVDVPECQTHDESAANFARRLALSKARAGRQLLADADAPVLGADTVVVVAGRTLGKPRDRADALDMLERLSGRTHEVLTAVALVGAAERVCLSTSRVRLRTTTAAEREAYWATGEPRDKAGGYAIQGRAAVFVTALEGSYSGVMGLPLFETAEMLREQGVDLWHAGDSPRSHGQGI